MVCVCVCVGGREGGCGGRSGFVVCVCVCVCGGGKGSKCEWVGFCVILLPGNIVTIVTVLQLCHKKRFTIFFFVRS